MKENSVQNQSYLRQINQQTIINHLRKEPLSCADLAKKMKLSNTAIAKITEELYSGGIITKHESKSQEVGRRPTMLSINGETGCVFAINLAGRNIHISVADLSGQIIDRSKIPSAYKITAAHLECAAAEAEKLRQRHCPNLKPMCACISAPGKIDGKSGDFLLAVRFADYKNINLKRFFSQRLQIPVLVHHDIKLALEGERIYGGALAGIKNAIVLYIDNSVGSALLLDGKIYGGSHGFAGELTNFSLNTLTDSDDLFFPQERNSLDSLSLEGIISIAKQNCPTECTLYEACKTDTLTVDMLSEAYISGEPFAVSVIGQAKRVWSRVIRNMAEFLDIDAVVLSGDIVKFGKDFGAGIEEYVNASLKFQDIKVVHSALGHDAPLLGGVHAAITNALGALLEKI